MTNSKKTHSRSSKSHHAKSASRSRSESPAPRRLTIRNPEDVLAAVPVVLGFHPHDSLVMVTASAAGPPMHARLDLPARHHVTEAVATLLTAAVRNRVNSVIFVVYGSDAALARTVARSAQRQFTDRGIDVLSVLRADAGCWFPIDAAAPIDAPGTPYDVRGHEFVAGNVYAGRVVHADRAGVVDSLRTDPSRVKLVRKALGSGCPEQVGPEQIGPVDVPQLLADLAVEVDGDDPIPAEAVARLLRVMRKRVNRDEIWLSLNRAESEAQVRLWSEIVRCCPAEELPPVACVLAFAAWLSGHGALAWVAIDRCREVAPDYALADVAAMLLEAAVSPGRWPELIGGLATSGADCESGSTAAAG